MIFIFDGVTLQTSHRHIELIIQLLHRNTRESFGELIKAVETLDYRLVFPQNFHWFL